MKNLILIIIFGFSITFAQSITEEEKIQIISDFHSDDYFTKLGAILNIIEYKIPDVLTEIENNFWQQDIAFQLQYLEAMDVLNSEYVDDYSRTIIDSIDVLGYDFSFRKKEDVLMRATYYLLSKGDDSSIELVFTIPGRMIFKTLCLGLIINNYPEHEEQAKTELIRLATTSGRENVGALVELQEKYPDEISEIYKEAVVNNPDKYYRAVVFEDLVKNNPPWLKEFIEERLLVESDASIRQDMRLVYLNKFGNPDDLDKYKNHLSVEPDTMYQVIGDFFLGRFTPPAPDSTVTAGELLDSLISYNQKCYQYGWLASEELKNKFDRYLNFVKVYLPEGRGTISKMILNKMIEIIQTSDESVVSKEATKFIGNNAVYLAGMIADGGQVFDVNDLTGSVGCTIQQNGNALVFNYEISNDISSSQSVFNFYVSGSVDSIMAAPAGWQENGEAESLSLYGFSAAAGENSIAAGGSRGGFSIASTGLPGIGNVYLQSERPLVDSADVFDNSFVAEAIVPGSPPETFVALEFVDNLIALNNLCLVKGWYTQSWAHNVQKVALDNTRLMLTLNVPASSLIIMQQFLLTMDSYHSSGFLTDDGFYLLKPNCDYLISKLQQM